MKSLGAGLTFVNVAVVSATFFGLAFGGLSPRIALVAFFFATALAILSWLQTKPSPTPSDAPRSGMSGVWFWLVASVFAFFAFRAFGWLLFLDSNQWKIQSVNNLGDLALHLTYIRNLANGVPLWPENPIYVFSHLRYPVGTDLFNSLLLLRGVDLARGLIWAGVLGSLATFYALYRWGGTFTVAGFLFNGGIAGFQILQTWRFLDYQGDKTIAWKSLALTMLVTQRGLLYALPAGLVLLYQWRARLQQSAQTSDSNATARPPLPFWVEVALYATMPLFHVHTFIALSIVAAFLFAIGDPATRRRLALLVGLAFLPATFFVYSITDHFQAGSFLKWSPGWVQGTDDFARGFVRFWFENFGILIPLVLVLLGFCILRARTRDQSFRFRDHPALAFLTPAALVFFFAFFIKAAPWGWDNIKLIIWAYLITLPFLWSELLARWTLPLRVVACVALFASGFVSLFGGLLNANDTYGFADRAELDLVGSVVKKLPPTARFAAFPTYNHPLLLQGRKLVLGYPGHLWTQGFDYSAVENKLNALMRGAPDWRQQARDLRVRYLFWGREEQAHYAESARPWEREATLVARGTWGAIYDLDTPPSSLPPRP